MLENTFSFSQQQDLNLYYCGERIQALNHIYGPEIRTHFIIVLVKDGTATYYLNNKTIKLHSGDILFMFPNKRIYYKVDEKSTWTISWIGVYGNILNNLVSSLNITSENPVVRSSHFKEICSLFDEILLRSFKDNLSNNLFCISKLYDFFSILYDANNNDSKNIENNSYIDKALHIMHFNYDKELTVEQIAESLHISMEYFSRLFKKTVGISPKAYLINQKIERACQLLTEQKYTINEIANSVGITDQLYFSKIFKKKMGVSPSKYLSELNAEEQNQQKK